MQRQGIIPATEWKTPGTSLNSPKPMVWTIDAPYPVYTIVLDIVTNAETGTLIPPDLNGLIDRFNGTLNGYQVIDVRKNSCVHAAVISAVAESSSLPAFSNYDLGTQASDVGLQQETATHRYLEFMGPWSTSGRWTFTIELANWLDWDPGVTELTADPEFRIHLLTYDPDQHYIPKVITVIHSGRKTNVSDGTFICHGLATDAYHDAYDLVKMSDTTAHAIVDYEIHIDGTPLTDLELDAFIRFGRQVTNDVWSTATDNYWGTINTYLPHGLVLPFTRPKHVKVRDKSGHGPYNIVWVGIKKVSNSRGPTDPLVGPIPVTGSSRPVRGQESLIPSNPLPIVMQPQYAASFTRLEEI